MRVVAKIVLLFLFLTISSSDSNKYSCYLFAHMGAGESEYWKLYYSYSDDGLIWYRLNGGGEIGSASPNYRGHPSIIRLPSGGFLMAGNFHSFGFCNAEVDEEVCATRRFYPEIWYSKDLLSWEFLGRLDGLHLIGRQGEFGAPKIFFDPISRAIYLTWHSSDSSLSMLDHKGVHNRAYWLAQRPYFIKLSAEKHSTLPFFEVPGLYSIIDLSIFYYGGYYHYSYKNEETARVEVRSSSSWRDGAGVPIIVSGRGAEAPNMYFDADDTSRWHIAFEIYPGKEIQRVSTVDFKSWSEPTKLRGLSNTRHGAMLTLKSFECHRLTRKLAPLVFRT